MLRNSVKIKSSARNPKCKSVCSLYVSTTYPAVLLYQMHTVLEEQLFVNLPQEAMEDSDTFRNESLYTEACDTVLQASLGKKSYSCFSSIVRYTVL